MRKPTAAQILSVGGTLSALVVMVSGLAEWSRGIGLGAGVMLFANVLAFWRDA